MNAAPCALKRPLDVLLAGCALALSAPVWCGAALGTYVTLGAPVLFRQPRPGLHGRPFTLLKFRTMRAPRVGEAAVANDDARLTRLGRWLRSTSIDELPSLLNVLAGDLSLVGPRPLLLSYLPRYSPAQARRHEVKPGLTGWAQVHGRNALSWEEKFAHDVWYVDHQSCKLDCRILLLTVLRVLQRSGVNAEGHATMPEFMGELAAPASDVVTLKA